MIASPSSQRRSRRLATLTALVLAVTATVGLAACGGDDSEPPTGIEDSPAAAAAPAPVPDDLPNGLLIALAELGKNEDGSPKPLPARLGMIRREGGEWIYSTFEDPDSNVFHKGMAFEPTIGEPGILTLGGTGAFVKLWRPDGSSETLWTKDFGGRFSRMRDAEVGDIDGDGRLDVAVATHDQGVVAVIYQQEDGSWQVDEIDADPKTGFVHEIELGDLDGDGALEVYATPSEPNKADGSAQHGEVVRYVPSKDEGRTVVADLGDRHAKEILVEDVDGDGTDELYVAVEAVSGGQVEIRRYDADTDATAGAVIATLDDTQNRFLTAGDVDGDGTKEMVAAAYKSGLFLLRPGASGGEWEMTQIDADSGGWEHASVLADLDADGTDELYVASDDHDEIRRYTYEDGEWRQELLVLHLDGLGRFTWNLMPAPVSLMPPASASAD
ncbi:MAG TPA: VCBS repeat-containing protein [Thermoanaerobaculia bacterium]|nr:VCBS repeat-containing protein [Thermoanaerobaculia bacterium]